MAPEDLGLTAAEMGIDEDGNLLKPGDPDIIPQKKEDDEDSSNPDSGDSDSSDDGGSAPKTPHQEAKISQTSKPASVGHSGGEGLGVVDLLDKGAGEVNIIGKTTGSA